MNKTYAKKKQNNINNKLMDNMTLKKNINFNVAPNMATLTFVEILKQQKHYDEALHVLSIIESKSNKLARSSKQILFCSFT